MLRASLSLPTPRITTFGSLIPPLSAENIRPLAASVCLMRDTVVPAADCDDDVMAAPAAWLQLPAAEG